MPRTKEFDPDVALRRALDLFRQRGYEATSIADLVEHLGLARASIYATFGGKHDLYLKALSRYRQDRDPDIVERLSRPGPALPAVRELVWSWVEECLSDPDRRGCLVVNAAVELAPSDREVARGVLASWNTLETALATALVRAKAQGELSQTRDPQAIARFLLVTLQGLRVLGRADPNPARLRDTARVALEVLDAN